MGVSSSDLAFISFVYAFYFAGRRPFFDSFSVSEGHATCVLYVLRIKWSRLHTYITKIESEIGLVSAVQSINVRSTLTFLRTFADPYLQFGKSNSLPNYLSVSRLLCVYPRCAVSQSRLLHGRVTQQLAFVSTKVKEEGAAAAATAFLRELCQGDPGGCRRRRSTAPHLLASFGGRYNVSGGKETIPGWVYGRTGKPTEQGKSQSGHPATSTRRAGLWEFLQPAGRDRVGFLRGPAPGECIFVFNCSDR